MGAGVRNDATGSIEEQEFIPINVLLDRAAEGDNSINVAIRSGLNVSN